LLAALVTSACSERQDDVTEPGPENAVDVTLTNFAFNAPTLTIDRGTTVRWRNSTGTFHTVTPDGNTVFEAWQTNSSGQTFEVRFDQPGTYRYFCEPHRSLGMMGVIEVR
jgi:plastocyanin